MFYGFREVSAEEAIDILEAIGENAFEYWLYPDGTEAAVDGLATREQIEKHIANGGKLVNEITTFGITEVSDLLIRKDVLINNLLREICDKTDIPLSQYKDWLRLEVGFTDEEITDLENADLMPYPAC